MQMAAWVVTRLAGHRFKYTSRPSIYTPSSLQFKSMNRFSTPKIFLRRLPLAMLDISEHPLGTYAV
jgi:hypothetical protein